MYQQILHQLTTLYKKGCECYACDYLRYDCIYIIPYATQTIMTLR
jgi:hypothetical protein